MPDPAAPPGRPPRSASNANVFVLDAEAGELHFGDGDRGRRPPALALMSASYDVSNGKAGNVAAGAISAGPTLPPGVKVANPLRTWGGADAEETQSGERRITAFLKHGDRLVTDEDHHAIALATPGLDVGRVEVLPAFDPTLSVNEPGDAPGAVTLMVIPRFDPDAPDAPTPNAFFLDAMCDWLSPRRLVTEELFLRAPSYVPVYVSVGIEALADRSIAEVREAVQVVLRAFLSPLPAPNEPSPPYAHSATGWPMRYAVRRLELESQAARADGVKLIRDVLLAGADGVAVERIEMNALQLPRLAGIAVVAGDPPPISDLRGDSVPSGDRLGVPVTEEAC